MGSRGMVQLGEALDMLEACAPGHRIKGTDHHYDITWNGKRYWRFPLGDYSKGRRALIEIGHVRKIINLFGISECVAAKFPHLIPKEAKRLRLLESEKSAESKQKESGA
jgi:hypothetical protein